MVAAADPDARGHIEGSYTGNLEETREILDARALRRDRRKSRSATRPLSEASEALEELKAGRVVGRVVLTP